MKEVHLFILWEHAREKEKEILDDINKNFKVLGKYNIKWNKENFSKNLSRFYGTNLPKNSGKEQHCGNGEFLLIIVEVDNPKYEERDTSKGKQVVNVNMFDKKTYYRELTGGGHKVHATNSEIETNHDLTLLLGKSIKDYLDSIKEEKNIETINIERELTGNDGFKSIKEMFYTLNNCINYTILRNYETLPDEIYVNDHNDVDIICDSLENAVYILNAEKVFKEDYRVHYKVKAENRDVFFDLRYVGDNYYYYKIEQEILNTRIYNEKGFYTISKELYFYTLLYHALLHKPSFAKDYKDRLQKMNSKYTEEIMSDDKAINLLNNWLLENGYTITVPIDISVQFNKENAKKFNELLYKNEMQNIEKISMLSQENNELREKKKRLEDELEKIVNSKSWRITKPIRDIKLKYKRK